MKQQCYLLKIDQPCDQPWSSMNPNSTGKFCSRCSKTVVDFAHLTDPEIIQIIEQTPGRICGRLSQQQLNRIIESRSTSNKVSFYKILASLLLIGATHTLAAEQFTSPITIASNINEQDPDSPPEVKNPVTNDTPKTIKGIVMDSTSQEPLVGAIVLIKDSEMWVSTDINGKFKLTVPDHLLTDKINLTISYLGYKKSELAVNKDDLSDKEEISIQLTEETLLIGEVVIAKRQRWKFWKRW